MTRGSLKIGFIYGPWCLKNREFNFSDVWNDPRGLTGSELSYLKVARGMADRGHRIRLYTLTRGPRIDNWEGLSVHGYDDRGNHGLDVAISWNESEPLRAVPSPVFKVVSWQLNKLDHCTPDVDTFVDMWISPSEAHRSRMVRGERPIGIVYGAQGVYIPDRPERWKVIPHGCEPDRYRKLGVDKVPGRVIWASSPDRGLHWLLQEWAKIRNAVPRATLKVFYSLESWSDGILSGASATSSDPDIIDQRGRALYIREAVRRLSGHGVEIVDSVSRNRIDREMAEAQVLAYSCDPVSWTEGFSVTLLEACAARACPVTTSVDALPEVYGGTVPMIELPVRDHIGEFSDLVVRALTDADYRDKVNGRVESFARSYSWESVTASLDDMIQTGLELRDSQKLAHA